MVCTLLERLVGQREDHCLNDYQGLGQ